MIEQKVVAELEGMLEPDPDVKKLINDENEVFLAIYRRQAQAQERIADALEKIAAVFGAPVINSYMQKPATVAEVLDEGLAFMVDHH